MSDSTKPDLSSISGEDLQKTVASILGNPAFGKILGELSGKTAPTPEETPAPQNVSTPQITPEMMAKLPQMMSALAPLLSGMQGEKKESGGAEKSSASDAEKRKKLLAALKPYLSSSRRDAVDSIMKVTEMTDLISQFGGMKPG